MVPAVAIAPERTRTNARPPAQKARDPEGPYKAADALVIDTGGNNEEELYSKSKALQTWLLGYEFTETVILVCSRSVHVLTSKKKGARAARPSPRLRTAARRV